MTIHNIINLCIDWDCRRLCLSPRQFKVVRKQVKVINGLMFYRNSIITIWSKS